MPKTLDQPQAPQPQSDRPANSFPRALCAPPRRFQPRPRPFPGKAARGATSGKPGEPDTRNPKETP